ncbi:MAG: hypothetical protein HBSAPP03_18240 [Phycisphaerae bacterium]|nr:MAG: hypothetical protein HBSAPP03_18240 [Phycisphaerae bacterium]
MNPAPRDLPARAAMTAAEPHILRLDAAGIADANGIWSPGSLLLELSDHTIPGPGFEHAHIRVLAVGSPAEVDQHPGSTMTQRRAYPQHLLIPGLVNAHTHLDLTAIGPQPLDPEAGFAGFIDLVRDRRPVEPAAIAESVREGVRRSLTAGVVAVGDIGGAPRGRPTLAAFETLASTPIHGVGYVEFFAIGRTESVSLERVESLLRDAASRRGRVRPGLSPHAPYSVSPAGYRRAVRLAGELGLPLATHLAESPDEHAFIAHASGQQRALLETLNLWDDALLAEFGLGWSPVAHLVHALQDVPRPFPTLTLVHVHDLGDDLEAIARLGACVAYCPRAGEYFGAHRHFGPHRYRELLARGVPVALGTDSIINLPTPRLGIWDEMRFLRRRDTTDPRLLLRMATLHGASALGMHAPAFAFTPGEWLAGVAAVGLPPGEGCPLTRALDNTRSPELLLLGK